MSDYIDKQTLRYYSIITNILKQKKEMFSEFEIDMIKDMILSGDYPNIYHQDVIRELFDEVGLLPDKENIYEAFIGEIDNQFNIKNNHIVEVGGGRFPRLAKRISLKQDLGTITVYDPRLDREEKSTDKMILKRENFTKDKSLKEFDLIVGLMPCQGINPLLDAAISNNKDFMVWFCEGGPHGDYYDYFEDDYEWFDSTMSHLEHQVKKNNMGKVKMKTLSRFSEYPIVYNER